MTVSASATGGAWATVERSGSANQPSVLKATAGRTSTSRPRPDRRRPAASAALCSKKPWYGTRPTTGYHQVYGASRSRWAAESTYAVVSRSSCAKVA